MFGSDPTFTIGKCRRKGKMRLGSDPNI